VILINVLSAANRKTMNRILFCVLFVLPSYFLHGQTSQELRKQQADIQKEIEDLRKVLQATQKNKKASLGELALVQKKLRLREQAIGNINSQINVIQGTISRSRSDIYKMRRELDTLRLQYQRSVVYAYKNRSSYDFLNFIFSAADFNDAFKRIEYLKVYRSFRQQQAYHIRQTQEMLKGKIADLEVTKKEKDQVLQSQEKEKQILQEERNEKDQVVKKLKMRETEINRELANKAKLDRKLRDGIALAIKRETEKATAAAKKSAPVPASAGPNPTVRAERPKSVLENTPEGAIISADFEKNKGRLPWPVEKGRIKIHYGVYSIEGTTLHGNNPGLTIETDAGASVRSIFEGEVITVFDVEGTSAIVVKHGKYFSSYGNLSSVSVGKGQKVNAGQMIGRAASNNDGNGEVEFLLMQESRNVNPEPWIR
jgi:septal ring factor EnvC (AmiA/AmiB activator)